MEPDRDPDRAEAPFRAAFEHAPVGAALLAPGGRWLRANRALCALLGYPEAELLALPWSALVEPGADAPDPAALARPDGPADPFDGEVRLRRRDGAPLVVHLAAVRLGPDSPAAGSGVGSVLVQVVDLTARSDREARLRHQATHDDLTGLPNRALFLARLETALAREGDPRAVAVLFVDLDGFKAVNDRRGHDAGDRLLAAVGGRLAARARAGDTVARWGGDEFTVLVEGLDAPELAARVRERFARALAASFRLNGDLETIHASIGVAAGRPGRDRADDLMRAADADLYRAKATRAAGRTAGR